MYHADRFRMISWWKGAHWRIHSSREIWTNLYKAHAGKEEYEPKYRDTDESIAAALGTHKKPVLSNMGAPSHMCYKNVNWN